MTSFVETSNTYYANIFGPKLQDLANFDSKGYFFA